MTKRVDDSWKRIQQTTFTNWANNAMRGHLKTAKNQVGNLETDLQDGLILTHLLEQVAAPKKIGKYYQSPKIKAQKLENLGACFRFMDKEKIKLVNIGPEDIYDGNLKLILGLIWTLIQKFQIRSTGKGLSTKNAMLAWINTQIPDQNIKNFTTDWNDGVALCALVDRIQPGLCPHYATLNRANRLDNCRLGMKLAENLNIHKVLEPEDFSHPDVDDLSVMTYLSYFCNPANEHLMKWVQSKIPERKITNFKTDWNNGINLACLVDALNPGIIPDARDLDPHDALDNLVRGMKIAEDHLAVKPVIKPSQMADPNVDELNVATYLSRFQYAKPVPQPHEVTCSGHGLYKAFLGRPAHFEVDASRGGVGDLKVTITAVGGSPVTAEITPNEHHKGTFEVKYVPQAPGKLKIAVQWSGFVIPASPFMVDVLDPGAFSFTGKQITGGQCVRVGKPVIMTAKGLIDIGDLYVLIQHTDGHTEAAKVVPKGTGEAECSYTPVRVGKDEVFAKIAGEDIPGSPFEVTVVDPGQCSVALKDPPPGKPVPVNYKATFVVGASEANLQGVIAEAKTPTGIQELNVVTQRDGTNLGYFTPVAVGSFSIIVTCAGENIRGSPLILPVSDPSRCAFLDTVPRYLQVGKPVELNISTKGAGPGELEVYSSQTGLLGAAIKKGERDFYALRLVPNAVGDSTVELKWNKATVSHTPFTVFVVDASKCSAYGPGLSEGKGKIGEAFVFTVQTARAGRGELVIKPKGPKSVYAAEITHDRDDTYTVKFTTYEQGPHSIEVLWGNTPIPNSPYKIQFVRGADAAQFTATGEGLKHAVALDFAECMLVGPEAGLLESGVLAVRVSGNQLESKVVNKSKFNPKCGQLVVCVTDIGNGSYDVKYAAPKPGSHSLSITCDNKHIPGSPFQIDVLPPGDASKCKAFGPAIDNPKSQVVGKPLEFKVDSTTAGTGQLVVTATDPSLHTLPVFVAEDKTMAKERIHNIKIEPKVQGKHKVEVTWGGSQIPGSPFSFEVSDPKHIKILGLPDSSSFIAVVGEPITFAVDAQRAGKGEVKAAAKLEDGKVDAFGKKMKENGTIGLTYTPKESGKMELLLTFSGINLLRLPWICQIANPRQFQVIPPKGYGKQKEYVKFPITGVTSDTQNFQLTATHPQHNATVKTEPGKGEGTVIVRFTAKQIGEYTVEVKHGGRHIDGSPFKTQVANPNGCRITSNIPKVLHIGVAESLAIDASESGPGEPGCLAEVLSGEGEIQPEISEEEEGKYTLKFTPEKIGKCRFVVKWADYVIPLTPFTVSFVDSSTITWACPELEKGYTNQGDVIEIQIDCREGGQAAPEVKATGPKSPYTVQIIDHKDGTFATKINPWQVGENSVDILWGGRSIPNSPIKFEVVRGVEARTITASGEGLHRAIAGQPAEIQINTPEEGLIERGVLSAKCTSENATEDQDPNAPSLDLKDSGSGSYTLTMVAPVEGQYQLVITCEGQPIVGSPFNITVSSAPNADKCNAFGGALEKKTGLVVKDPVQFSVDATDAGTGHLTVSATQPNGNPIRVYMLEEGGERKLHHLKLDPQVIGHYSVAVFWEEDLIPGSPFDFNILDPSKCKVNGLPLPTGTAHINETVPFTVLFKDAGQDVSPSVTVSLPGDGEQITLNPTPESTATLSYAYVPDMLGFSRINVSYGGYDVPGSPFKCLVTDPSQFHITPLNIKGDYALVCELVSFGIVGKIPEGERLAVAAHGPSADLNVEVVDKGDGSSIATFVPIEPGSYEVFVECAGSHVTGSPFTVYVADPSKCQFLGDIPNTLQVGKPEEFVVKTRGAGAGNLAVLLDNLKENQYVDCKIENQGLDTHAVTLTGKKIGEANVELQWAGYTIPQSPFKVMVCDAQQCKAYGQALMSKKGRAGEMITFTVVAIHAGKGKLTVRPRGPSAQYNVDMKETKDLTYEVSFTPWEVGEHKVDVLWGDAHIPKSPFVINVDNPVDTNVCNATGEGLKEAIAGHTATFTIISSEIGLLDKNALRVSVIGVQSAAEVKVKDNNNGSYTVEYVAPTAGAYIASVAFYDRQIPGSPFKVNVVPGPDATKCRAYGPALHPNSLHIAGTPLEFYVDTSEGGHGSLRVYVQGPHDYRPKIYQADDGKGVYSIKFDAMKSGKYFLVVAWSDQHIPGSPFKVRVHPAADASKVKVYGPGLEDGYLEDGGEFTVETRNAGIGTLLIRVHGIKDSFKIEAAPKSDHDTRTLIAQYHPKLSGEYVIFVRWSGVHVPGSPFTVRINKRAGESDSLSDLSQEGDAAPQDKDILESTFAQQPPTYDAPTKQKKAARGGSKKEKVEKPKKDSKKEKKKSEKQPKKEKSPSKKEGTGEMPRSPSGGLVGPVAPSMKMKPLASLGGLAQPGYVSPQQQGHPQQPVSPTRVAPPGVAPPGVIPPGHVLVRTPSGSYIPVPAGYFQEGAAVQRRVKVSMEKRVERKHHRSSSKEEKLGSPVRASSQPERSSSPPGTLDAEPPQRPGKEERKKKRSSREYS